jgi:hypothetical protein
MIEKIDRPEGKEDPTQELIDEIIRYIESDKSISTRLSLERKLGKYIESNNVEWNLNLILRLYQTIKLQWQTKESLSKKQ